MIRILIVDDEEDMRKLLVTMLEPYGECTPAEDGPQAIKMFEDALNNGNPYHVVTVDVMMPYMNGHEALQKIREIETNSKIDAENAAKTMECDLFCRN